MAESGRAESYPLRRRDVAARLNDRSLLIITGPGAVTWDFTAAGDGPHLFPFWNALGGAVASGLGLALARPDRRVLVALGDGDMLMGLGSLATVAAAGPKNLAVAVFDNERYGETGMQATHTAFGADIAGAARGLGIPCAGTVTDEAEFEAALPLLTQAEGPVVQVIKVRAEPLAFVTPARDGGYLKDRFRLALLGPDGVS